MSTFSERLDTAVVMVEEDANIFHEFVHDNTAGEVVTEGGTYPTLETLVQDAQDALADFGILGPLGDGVGEALETDTDVAGGFPTLDDDGLIRTAQLPAIAITDTFVVVSQAAMLALSAEKGDVAVRTDENKTYVLSSNSPSTLADWKEMYAAGGNLRIANNLSDLANAATARTNLGLGTGNSPTFTGLTLSGLNTANGVVQTNSSGVLSTSLTPSGLTSLGVNTITSAAGQNLVLALGTGGTALTLTTSTLAATFAGTISVGTVLGGRPTHPGLLQIFSTATGLAATNGLEFEYDATTNGYGFKIATDSSTDNLVFGARANSVTWTSWLTLRSTSGVLTSASTTEATTGGAGSINTAGGIYATKAIITGSTTASSSTTTGALIVGGGAGIAGNAYIGGNIATAGVLHGTTFTNTTIDVDLRGIDYTASAESGATVGHRFNTAGTYTSGSYIATFSNNTSVVGDAMLRLAALGVTGLPEVQTRGGAPYVSYNSNNTSYAYWQHAGTWTVFANSSGDIALKPTTGGVIIAGANNTAAAALDVYGSIGSIGLKIRSTAASTSTTTGSGVFDGGVGVAGASFFGSTINFGVTGVGEPTGTGAVRIEGASAVTTGSNGIEFKVASGSGYGAKLYINSASDYFGIAGRYNSATWTEWFTLKEQTGVASFLSTTASTSTTTGALIVGGGVGIGGDLFLPNSESIVWGTTSNGSITVSGGTMTLVASGATTFMTASNVSITLALATAVSGLLTASAGLTVASGQALTLGNAAAAETPTATHTLQIKDSTGTTYKVLALAA